jgi:hypothetical protein
LSLRLAYLTVTNAFAALWLLPMGDRDKDAEIFALRHQITILERQLGIGARVRFASEDRAFLAALLAPLSRDGLLLGLAGFLHGTDVARSGVVHEDVDATMSSDDLGHRLVMARVSGRAPASARITPASC